MARLTYKKLLQDMAEREVRKYLFEEKDFEEAYSKKMKVLMEIEHDEFVTFKISFKHKDDEYIVGGAISRLGVMINYINAYGHIFYGEELISFVFL